MQLFRKSLFKQTKHLLYRMDKLIKSAFQVRVHDSASAMRAKDTTIPAALQDALLAVAGAVRVASLSLNDCKIVMFRLMACAPWSAYDVMYGKQMRIPPEAGLMTGVPEPKPAKGDAPHSPHNRQRTQGCHYPWRSA